MQEEHGYRFEIECTNYDLIDKLYANGKLPASFLTPHSSFENQYFVVRCNDSVIPIYVKNGNALLINDLDAQQIYSWNRNFTPKDIRQRIALKYLNDDSTQCAIIMGKAGTAKTFLSLSYGMKALAEGKFKKMYLIKPVIPVMQNEYLGTLPGGLDEKIQPFMESFYDAIGSLNLIKTFEAYLETGMIEFQPISYIRGRHLENALVIVDEAQNLAQESLIAVATRISAIGSKLVLLLDPNTIQKDHKASSGVSRLLNDPQQRVFQSPSFGVIELVKRMRSNIGAVIEDILLEAPQLPSYLEIASRG